MCVSLELNFADPLVLARLPACSSCRLILLCLVHTLNDRPNVPVDFISPATSKVSRLLSVINFVKEEEGRSQKEGIGIWGSQMQLRALWLIYDS